MVLYSTLKEIIMNISNRIKSILANIRMSIKRFPLTVIVSSILAISLIYLNEGNLSGREQELVGKISLLLGLGLTLSFLIGLALERLEVEDKFKKILAYGLGAIALLVYYMVFFDSMNTIFGIRYFATQLAIFIMIFFIQRIKRDENYEYYVMDIIGEISLTIVYSIVLYAGLAFILFTIDALFNANIPFSLYINIFILVVFVFAVALFLSRFPEKDKSYNSTDYTRALRVLLTYIVIPLISIYTAILYVYFGKIIITRIWPSGLVSHLVVWYSTVSVGVLFLISPLIETDKIAKTFKKIFPKAILPILLMMFISIGIRISQYGITENRYYLVLLGIWILGMMLYFAFSKRRKNIIIAISLSVFILISVYGPLSSFSIARASQNNRLEKLLEKNQMLVAGEIVKNPDISQEDRKEINNIISYFSTNHRIDQIKVLPDDFNLDRMEDHFGFKYEAYNPYGPSYNEYFYYGVDKINMPILIGDYKYYLEMASWNNEMVELEGLDIRYIRSSNILELKLNNSEKLAIDMKEYVEEIHLYESSLNIGDEFKDGNIPLDRASFEDTFTMGDKSLEMKFIITSISGKNENSDEISIDHIEFIILLDISDN